MISAQNGSVRLFRFAGIQVYLHWSWLVVALYQISTRAGAYDSPLWKIAEYVGLFAIVLLHEFGHAFASRQVGGESREILLWPFGGIAFVRVPPRPGAELWSIAAGPLVNVVLLPILFGLTWLSGAMGWSEATPDLGRFLAMLASINLFVLIFNVLPIYPMDGGQILRSLLWFWLGRAKSLRVASFIGFFGVGLLILRALWIQSVFSGFVALFLGQQCWLGWKHAQALQALAKLPRHRGFSCPTCHDAPVSGPLWGCRNCGGRFDPFSTGAVCPHCAAPQALTTCPNCGAAHPITTWSTGRNDAGVPPVIDV